MVVDFIEHYARLIVAYPEDISIQMDEDGDICSVMLYANPADIGKLIGKEGKMIGAIKTVISGCKAKDGKSYRINVEACH